MKIFEDKDIQTIEEWLDDLVEREARAGRFGDAEIIRSLKKFVATKGKEITAGEVAGWIEGVPDDALTWNRVLVTICWADDDLEVRELDYGVAKIMDLRIAKQVIAWRPMPDPFRGTKEGMEGVEAQWQDA